MALSKLISPVLFLFAAVSNSVDAFAFPNKIGLAPSRCRLSTPPQKVTRLYESINLDEKEIKAFFESSSASSSYLDEDDEDMDAIYDMTPYSYVAQVLQWIPVTAILAYFTYPQTLQGFRALLDGMATNKNWHDVDGGHFRIDLLLPPTNSIVVPMMSLLFAILVGTTVGSFRQRMLGVDSSLNKESKDLEVLARLVGSIGRQSQTDAQGTLLAANFVRDCNKQIIKYCSRICEECQSYEEESVSASSTDCEMNAVMESTLEFSDRAYAKQVNVNPTVLSEMFGTIRRLNDHRTDRISALNATYPAAHYMILVVLASAIMASFLMETDLSPNLFLNDVELRLLWGLLVGTFALVAKVILDLASPFDGDYRITSWTEFLVFRERLKKALRKNK